MSAAELIGEASEEELRNLVVDALEASPAARLQTALVLAGRRLRRWASVAALLRSASDPLADFEVEPRMYRNVADRCDLSAPAWVLYADDAVSRLLEWARSCEDRAEPAAAAMPVLALLFSPRHGDFRWAAALRNRGLELLSVLVVACDPKELASLLGPILASPHVEAAESISGLLPSLSAEQSRSLASLLAGFAATPNPPQPPAPQDWPEWAAACEDLAAFRERALYWVDQLASPV